LDSDAFKPKGFVLYISDGFLFSEVFFGITYFITCFHG
jgi:hypothetical protein